MPYPGVVELGLDADIVALFLVLRPQHLELGGFQRANSKCHASQSAIFEGRGFKRSCHGATNLSASAASVTVAPTSQSKRHKSEGATQGWHTWEVRHGVDRKRESLGIKGRWAAIERKRANIITSQNQNVTLRRKPTCGGADAGVWLLLPQQSKTSLTFRLPLLLLLLLLYYYKPVIMLLDEDPATVGVSFLSNK